MCTTSCYLAHIQDFPDLVHNAHTITLVLSRLTDIKCLRFFPLFPLDFTLLPLMNQKDNARYTLRSFGQWSSPHTKAMYFLVKEDRPES